MRYEFRGLYLEGLIHGGAYFRNFTVCYYFFFFFNFFFQVFAANSDRHTIVSHALTPRFRARYVRFVAMTWHSRVSMRVELYGCAAP